MASAEPRGGEAPPGLDEVRAWIGHRLDELDGARAGSVAGVLVASASDAPEWLLARLGRFGHHTPIPVRDAVEGFGRIWVPYPRELIREAPWLEPDAPLRAGLERELLAHYAIAPDAARSTRLAELDPTTITARPA